MNSVVKPGVFARAVAYSALVALLSWTVIQLGLSPVQAEGTTDEPAVDAVATTINVDTFVGGDYAEFWWDSSQIAGCSYVTIKRDGAVIAPKYSCGANSYKDTGLDPSSGDITYRFYFYNSEDTLLNSDFGTPGYVSPGKWYGTLHSQAAISGNATIQNFIAVAQNGTLTIQSGAIVTGGTIYDDVERATGGCSATPGQVVASGATLNDTQVSLCSGTSVLQNNAGTAVVSLFAAAKVSGNALKSIYVEDESGGALTLPDNVLTDGGIHIRGSSDVYISGCEFHGANTGDWTVLFRDDSTGIVEKSSFETTTKYPIQLATSQGVSVQNNEIKLNNTDSSAAAIFIDPQANGAAADYSVAYNVLIGPDAGIGLNLYGQTGSGSATLNAEGNTISRFQQGVWLQRSSSSTPTYSAQITNNSIVNSTKDAIYSNLTGSQDHVTATGNCFADNQEYAVRCYTTNEIDARGNYWGHETGPSVSSNPDGKGEGVYCSKIDVADWLSDHSCSMIGLDIEGIEAVQTIQTIDNQVPLVEHKATMVRVYPGVASGSATVQGELTGFRDGVQLGTLQSTAPAKAGVISDWNEARGNAEASLNFRLPDSWLHGQVDLIATLDADVAACGVDVGKPQMEKSISFSARKTLKIGYIPITIDTATQVYRVNIGDIAELHKAVQALFPLADIEVKVYPEETITWSWLPELQSRGGNQLMRYSINVMKYEREAGEFDADIYITVNSVDTESFAYTYYPSNTSLYQCSMMRENRYCLYMVGRNLGLSFVPEQGEPSGYSWPYDDQAIHDFGIDMRSGSVIPASYYDIMSSKATFEESKFWISPFHYQKAFNNVGPPVEAASPVQAAAETLLVTGIASADDGYLYPVDQVSGMPVAPTQENAGGAYCVRSMAGGNMLDSYCFDLDLDNPEDSSASGSAIFVAYLAPNAGITSIQLLKGGAVLTQLDVPTAQPVASIKSAGYDAVYKKVVAALNIDAGVKASYRYSFLYSADNGASWTPVGTDVHPDSLNLINGAYQWGFSASAVQPGSQSRIKVLVSDGFHTTELTSDTFTVSDLGPEVGIDTPDQNAVINTFPATFSGYAWDVDDGDRSDAIVWSSSVDGNLGSGESLDVASLSSGVHIVTATAKDEAGHAASDTVRITVNGSGAQAGVYLPTMVKP